MFNLHNLRQSRSSAAGAVSGAGSPPPAGSANAAESLARTGRRGRRRRLMWALVAIAVALAAAVATVIADPFAGGGPPQRGVLDNTSGTSLATVTRGSLASKTEVSGTLGYAAAPDGSPYQVINQANGTLSALPPTGAAIGCGQVLYRVSDSPVVLLCGPTPAYRSLYEGNSGPDVEPADMTHDPSRARAGIDRSRRQQ